MPCGMACEIGGDFRTGGTRVNGLSLLCLLKPVIVVGKCGIYEGEKGLL